VRVGETAAATAGAAAAVAREVGAGAAATGKTPSPGHFSWRSLYQSQQSAQTGAGRPSAVRGAAPKEIDAGSSTACMCARFMRLMWMYSD
jgi:hypothetical protein